MSRRLAAMTESTFALVDSLRADDLPEGPDELLAEVEMLTPALAAAIAVRDAVLARQTRCFRALRECDPKITFQRIGTAAGITEEAVIRRLRPPKDAEPAAPVKKAAKSPSKKAAAKKASARKR